MNWDKISFSSAQPKPSKQSWTSTTPPFGKETRPIRKTLAFKITNQSQSGISLPLKSLRGSHFPIISLTKTQLLTARLFPKEEFLCRAEDVWITWRLRLSLKFKSMGKILITVISVPLIWQVTVLKFKESILLVLLVELNKLVVLPTKRGSKNY